MGAGKKARPADDRGETQVNDLRRLADEVGDLVTRVRRAAQENGRRDKDCVGKTPKLSRRFQE